MAFLNNSSSYSRGASAGAYNLYDPSASLLVQGYAPS